jgi:hypothetical protein
VRFGEWYSLSSAGDLAPAGAGVFQVRLAHGLIDYPRGKSAMVWYEHAEDVRAAVTAFAARQTGRDLVCRHLIEVSEGVDLAEFCAKLRGEFVRRFGRAPELET